MKNLKAATLVGMGMVIGCGAAATVPAAFATPHSGAWACYRTVDMIAPDFGASNKVAKKYTAGMNRFAKHTAAGTVLNISAEDNDGAVCIKY